MLLKKFFNCLIFLIVLAIPVFSTEQDKKPLRLSFTGDMMAHAINYSMEDYSLIYKDIEYILQNDSLSFCNVEFPVDSSIPQASYPSFNIHPEYVEAAINAGIDVVSIANNHIADRGIDGLLATVESFNTIEKKYKEVNRDIFFSGASKTIQEVPEIKTIYKDGWKIGFTAVTQFSNYKIEESYMPVIDYRNEEIANSFLDWIKEVSSDYDLFVLSYHAGEEYRMKADPLKNEYFKRLVTAGVDILWSHHPHIMQPIDVLDKDGYKKVIMNSMGNFISGQGCIADPDLPEEEWSYTGDSAILQIDVSFDGHSAQIDNILAIPIANVMKKNRNVVIIPMKNLTQMAVSEPWVNFFMERYILMHDYFIQNIRSP